MLRISFGLGMDGTLAPRHLRRVHQLELVDRDGFRWSLTATGRERCDSHLGLSGRPIARQASLLA
ncbi:hypothetical protein RSO01_66410 [Reyranella soli]|uniref:Uncharacterized protein n=1 Tax=Reyranella soli TaxID=1230389 RepID=A0A512NKM0_9HYPH|nr:hypothetical protein RSO01_66410 [Reyranella soli]